MTQLNQAFRFRQSCLVVAVSMLLTPSTYALQDLPDEALSNTTGEGVALLPENFKFVFQGPNDLSTASSYNKTPSVTNPEKYDTGFIRIIPRGGNYEQLFDQSRQAVYDNIYFQNYTAKVSSYYQTYYTDIYNAEYSSVYNNATTKANVLQEYTTTYKASFENEKVEEFAAQTVYVNKYDELYKAEYKKYNWCFNTGLLGCKNDEQAQAWAYDEVRNQIRKDKANEIATYANNQLEQKTNTEMDLRAIRSAKAKAQASYTSKELTLRTNAVAAATTALNNTDHVAALKASRSKADIFIYGLALSKSNGNMNQRFSNQGLNWGTAENPWLFRSGTAKDIQQYNAQNKSNIAYIALEAPLAQVGGNATEDKIKLGFWTDIFSRTLDSSNKVDQLTGAPVDGLDKNYRLRAQFVANGLSIDGSQVRLFQTQSSTVTQQSQTLGMASILRLNTNDDPSLLKITDTNLDAKGIRISTAAKSDNDDGTASTPALDRSFAPLFNDKEGLYLYSTNINLVLGNMYQPFIIGSEGNNIILELTRIPNVPDIYTKIYSYYADTDANNALVKKDATTNTVQLKGVDGTYRTIMGTTCNVASCGTNTSQIVANGKTTDYQGTNATHSSISIGSVTRDAGSNMLKANRDQTSTGVVFKNASGGAVNLGSAVIDGVLIQHLKIKTTGL
ncbi:MULTISPECIES: hypothetical protein [Acinetobacter]|uniref:Uncharacterized protein n=1 Tax=Acinetobacter chengduensis TaxID=2420890 RepID=A0ABX9TVT1_9GAMM|nr:MULTISPECIES: hypothetical protein [Acinetobacter]MBI1450967.1 hypothetical protein [Acinetobacter sp. FL51]RKG41171.1 hypothetical protein D7V31_10850 [Acinetobacter sp. WCHAc060007]RLL21173.1 hypothetical protein D9K81_10655 [Acinetobacter chengduensis]